MWLPAARQGWSGDPRGGAWPEERTGELAIPPAAEDVGAMARDGQNAGAASSKWEIGHLKVTPPDPTPVTIPLLSGVTQHPAGDVAGRCRGVKTLLLAGIPGGGLFVPPATDGQQAGIGDEGDMAVPAGVGALG